MKRDLTTPESKAQAVEATALRIANGESLRKAGFRECGSPANYCRWRDALAKAGGDPAVAFNKPIGRPRSPKSSV
jgi:hypothetical protein